MRTRLVGLALLFWAGSAAAQTQEKHEAVRPRCSPCGHRSAESKPAPPHAAVIDTVLPGRGYSVGPTTLLLGSHYRTLWATPIAVPVLDLHYFAGGLTPDKKGGGRQTIGLHMKGHDGNEYKFRSVEKEASRALPAGLRKGTSFPRPSASNSCACQ